MARVAKISQLKAELNQMDESLNHNDDLIEPPAANSNKRIEFVIEGYRVTVEPI
ncbi:hypothetical protein [Macrococcus animalis]|uniref:hypothetical protein n=1 Tax=Macrococcus animalis TaxID=3395467 RepID=UPI0039BE1ACE